MEDMAPDPLAPGRGRQPPDRLDEDLLGVDARVSWRLGCGSHFRYRVDASASVSKPLAPGLDETRSQRPAVNDCCFARAKAEMRNVLSRICRGLMYPALDLRCFKRKPSTEVGCSRQTRASIDAIQRMGRRQPARKGGVWLQYMVD
jgi:hypothetical protein